MTSLEVIDTDAFLDMPVSSQNLYFHLNARADDDGFVAGPKKILRALGASGDDYKVLLAKKFLIEFEDGVCVIKHWRINNFIRKDRYNETQYLDHKQILFIRANGAYTMSDDESSVAVPLGHFQQEDVNQRLTEGQLRIGKDREESVATAPVVVVVQKEDQERSVEREPTDPFELTYGELCSWGEKRRGFPFVNRKKQYSSLKKARLLQLGPEKLKDRWKELEMETWRDGFDWTSVVSSFDKRS